MRELRVEARKMFFRIDFYIAFLLMVGITSFLIYQLSTEGTIVTIEGEGAITFNDLMESIFSMMHHLGLVSIILAILCWQLFGKEVDNRNMTIYFLHSRDKWKLLFSKIVIVAIAFLLIWLAVIVTMIGIHLITKPEQFEFVTNSEEILRLIKMFSLIMLSGLTFISLTAIISLRFGSLGVLFTTVGLSIISSILSNNIYLKQFLPLNLITNTNSYFESIAYLVCYFAIAHVLLFLISRYREIGA